MTGLRAVPSMAPFFRGVMLDKPQPLINFSFQTLPKLRVIVHQKSSHTPVSAQLFRTRVNKTKDGARPMFVNAAWHSTPLASSDGMWKAEATAGVGEMLYIALEYEWPEPGSRFSMTTPVLLDPLESAQPDDFLSTLVDAFQGRPHAHDSFPFGAGAIRDANGDPI